MDIVNVLAELERAGIKWEPASDSEVKVKCPFHPDNSPSCFVNIHKSQFYCQAAECKKHGDVFTLFARFAGCNRATIIADWETRYDISEDKLIEAAVVEKFHAAVWNAGPLLQALYERGLTVDDIRAHRIGFDGERLTIPVRNMAGNFVNMRRYLPGASGPQKMKSVRGHNEMRPYPIDQLSFDDLLVTGGECKAIVAARQLNPYGIGAFCVTAGEGNWSQKISHLLRGKKRVWVMLDIDKGGMVGAEALCMLLRPVIPWVGNATPGLLAAMDIVKHPKGDINDFIGKERGQLHPILAACPAFVPKLSTADYGNESPAEDLDLSEAIHAEKANKRVRVNGVVTSMDTAPYIIPSEVNIMCSKDQKFCGLCPVFNDDKPTWPIPSESPAILEMIAAAKERQLDVIKSAVGIPAACRACAFNATTHYNVEDARVSPQLQITNRSRDRVLQPAYCIGGKGKGLDLNEAYNFSGRMLPHPRNQQAVLLISQYETSQDALSTYQCTNPSELGIFWPTEWTVEGIQAKLDHIYSDFEANVTRIFQRRDVHLCADLAYHSPLFFKFDDKLTKGWVEVLIMGDSSQGKSDIVCGSQQYGGLQAHYGLGEKVECKNCSAAGLVGGLQKSGDRWFVTWGVMPTHDKRLVIWEEVKGMSTEIVSKTTDMRSRGIAELDKIEKRRTHARTRLIAISNPRSDGMTLSQYSFGVQAVKELIGALEDVRRFDMCMLVSENDIDPAVLNTLKDFRPHVEHVYTGELCRRLILWAWTRTQEQVIFTDEATALCLEWATYMCGRYTGKLPICDRGSMRYKMARLAAALAVRTFSCTDDFENVVIHGAHVQYIGEYLDRLYSSHTFGYRDLTQATEITERLLEPDVITAKIAACPYPRDLCKSLLAVDKIELQDLCDFCAWDRTQAQDLLSFFVRKHALMRDGRVYRKTASFIVLMKELLEQDGKLIDPPEHVNIKEF